MALPGEVVTHRAKITDREQWYSGAGIMAPARPPMVAAKAFDLSSGDIAGGR